jgi:hypothetical protein
MREFEKSLRGLSQAQLEQCAKTLLERLNGAGAAATVERQTWDESGEKARKRQDYGQAAEVSATEAADAYAQDTGGETKTAETAQETVLLRKRLDELSREREKNLAGEDGDNGVSAAFRGPERRYDNAVGSRGMEMSRVSDFFRRDSRRYDAGFEKY